MAIDKEIQILLQNIKYLRETNGLSKKEMSRVLGISVLTLNKMEQGIMPPSVGVDIVFRLSEKFNIKPCDLFKNSVK